MNDILTEALRPRTLDELVGGRAWVGQLRNRMSTRPPRALMLHGGPGCGKTSAAWVMAVAFQCPHQELWGNPCASCWAQRHSFAIHEINASQFKGVEEMEKLVNQAGYAPMPPSQKRVFILDEAQGITAQAQQLLLKPTEKISEKTVWIIATTAPEKISAALRRRFAPGYALHGLNPERTELLLKRAAKFTQFKGALKPLVDELDKADISSPALILMALEHHISGASPLEAIVAVQNGLTTSKCDAFQVAKAVTAGNWRGVQAELKKAQAEDSRWIRASVGGYLKSCLLNTDPARAKGFADGLRILFSLAPLDDPSLFPWLCGTLHHICSTFRKSHG